MNNELISVIVPVYNVEKYLEKCVNSIRNQTYKNLEIILVDDGSPDNSGILCDELAKLDDRIVVYHKENGGLSDARNYGVTKARGTYIGFVDSDDYIHEKMYEELYQAIKRTGTSIAECGVTRVYKNGLRPHYEGEDYFLVLDRGQYLKEYLLNTKLYGSAWCKLLHVDLAKKIEFPVGKIYEDAFYTLALLNNVEDYTIISGNYYFYYMRENSITTRPFSAEDMDYIEIMDKIKAYTLVNYPQYQELLNIRLAFAYLSIFNQLIQVKEYKKRSEYRLLKDKLSELKSVVIKDKQVPKKLRLALILLGINEQLYKYILSKYAHYENND